MGSLGWFHKCQLVVGLDIDVAPDVHMAVSVLFRTVSACFIGIGCHLVCLGC